MCLCVRVCACACALLRNVCFYISVRKRKAFQCGVLFLVGARPSVGLLAHWRSRGRVCACGRLHTVRFST